MITAIVDKLDYDSDLWDDIYESHNCEVFRPLYSDEEAKNEGCKNKTKINVDYHVINSLEQCFPHNEESRRGKKPSQIFAEERGFRTMKEARQYVKTRVELFQFYIYLRRVAILYRDTQYKLPYQRLMQFLETETGKKYLNNKLRVKATRQLDELWNTGLHEWVTCSQTIECLKRTAGERRNKDPKLDIQSHIPECIWGRKQPNGDFSNDYYCAEFNWLDLQLLMRTPTKYVIFLRDKVLPATKHVIFVTKTKEVSSGHTGAVKSSLSSTDGRTDMVKHDEKKFHDDLNTLFNQSKTIFDYVNGSYDIYSKEVFNIVTDIGASSNEFYLIDGSRTAVPQAVSHFQANHLQDPSTKMYLYFDEIRRHISIEENTHYPEKNDLLAGKVRSRLRMR